MNQLVINDMQRVERGRCVVHLTSGERISWPVEVYDRLQRGIEEGHRWFTVNSGVDSSSLTIRLEAVAAVVVFRDAPPVDTLSREAA